MSKDGLQGVLMKGQTDSTEGLRGMYNELEPYASKLRTASLALLFFGAMRLCSIQGVLAVIASSSIVCLAAPGSLGVAHAARFARPFALMAGCLAMIVALGTTIIGSSAIPVIFEHVQNKTCPRIAKRAELGLSEYQYEVDEFRSRALFEKPDHDDDDGKAHMLKPMMTKLFHHDEEEDEKELKPYSAPAQAAIEYIFVPEGGSVGADSILAECMLRAEQLRSIAPLVLVLFALTELGLAISAFLVAKYALQIVTKARSCGANAM